jgi:exonuclease SbcC
VTIRRLRVHPFGFFADKEVPFLPGLNVVLGPNEAGKSTLFFAIKNSLLRTGLTKKEFMRFLARFLPSGGGDTLRVDLEFQTDGGTYLLTRRWGPKPGSELTLPGGGSLTEEDAVGAMGTGSGSTSGSPRMGPMRI